MNYAGASTQLFSEINSMFDAQKDGDFVDTFTSPHHTRSSHHKEDPSLNLGGNWRDDSLNIDDSSASPIPSDDNSGAITVTGKLPKCQVRVLLILV